MKISTILDHIDNGHMALPEFQRGYVWNRDQVRGLMASLYRRHPVGSLLVWATQPEHAATRGDQQLAQGVVKLLLDGQQRITSLYGIVRGRAPKFFDGNASAFTDLRFNVETEDFSFYSPINMGEDPLWVDVTELMRGGNDGLGLQIGRLTSHPEAAPRLGIYIGRLSAVLGIKDIDFHIDEVTGVDKTIDVVVDIFNRVNSGGTKLSKGDLALAKICAEAPDARERMKVALARWRSSGYNFDLDWLLRNVNTVTTGEAKFHHLHNTNANAFRSGLERAEVAIDSLLNLVSGRLGLDHDRVLFGRFAFPVMVHYLDRRGGKLSSLDAIERDKLLFWYLQSALWGRFSGSTESVIDRDLELLSNEAGLDNLINELRLWHGSLIVQPGNFAVHSVGSRFYPVLYLLTRIGEARDWGTGLPLKEGLFGKMNQLEVHHIFPKARLYKKKFGRSQVNAVANFCFLTKDTNLKISARHPEEYFSAVESKHPGALASQWIPMDEKLWKVERYLDFLEARRALLADAINAFLKDLLHGQVIEIDAESGTKRASNLPAADVQGTIDEEEEQAIDELNKWVEQNGLPRGEIAYELSDPGTGQALAVLDLAWPDGVQRGLSERVCVLLNEPPETLATASKNGFRCFVSPDDFKTYVARELIVLAAAG
jgi:hypothetical protein